MSSSAACGRDAFRRGLDISFATFDSYRPDPRPPRERPAPAANLEYRQLDIPGDLDDRQLADHIQAQLAIAFAGPAPNWSLRRNDDGNLQFRLFTPARRFEILVLEGEGRIRLRTLPFDTWQFLFHLHEMTPSHVTPDWPVQAWAWYVEFSIWSLPVMALTGVYLWLASRPGHRWAQISFAAGTLLFAAFYIYLR